MAIVASLGGILVFIGLWMEGAPDQKSYTDVSGFRRAKQGWIILMVGISMEVIVAAVLAIKEGWNATQTAKMIANNDPFNKPISSIAASMHFKLKPTSRNDAPSEPQSATMIEFLEEDINRRTLNLGKFGVLYAHEVTPFEHTGNGIHDSGLVIELRVSPFNEADFVGSVIENNQPITPRLFMDRIRAFQCYLTFIKKESQILDGTAEVVINGTFRKEFQIYSQKTFKELSDWRTNGNGSYFYATNSLN